MTTGTTDAPVSTPGDPLAEAGGEMTLFEHLNELRQRLFKSAVAVALGFVVGFVLRDRVFDVLVRPYCNLPSNLRQASSAFDDGACTLIFTDVLGAFFISLKAAAVVAVVLAGPVVFYQVWRFVTPGLRPVEKRYAVPFLVISQLLFAAGAAFSYLVIPRGLEFLLGFAGDNVASLMDASRYLSFLLRTMIAFGVAFEFPLILCLLSLMGVVNSSGLRKHRRLAYFGTCVGAAFITPPDPASMVFMAGPLIVFYEGCVLFARLVERRRQETAVPA
jgi:sec-independent protein translocase protein TatC